MFLVIKSERSLRATNEELRAMKLRLRGFEGKKWD